MKKGLFILAVLVVAFGNMGMAQQRVNLKSLDKAIMLKHYGLRDGNGMVPQTAIWRNTEGYQQKRTYIYDEYDYYLSELLEQYMSDGDWVNHERVTYEYDFDGNVLESYDYAWHDNDWYDIQRALYSYEVDKMEIIYQWREIGGEWQNGRKEVYDYNGEVTTMLIWSWNGNTWTSSELYTYTFGSTSIEVLKQYMQGGAWQNRAKDTYTLDFDGIVTEILTEDWQNNAWVNERKVSYYFGFGSSDYDVREVFDWENGAWVQDHRSSYSYQDGNATHAYCVRKENGEFEVVDGTLEMAYGNNTYSDTFFGCEIEMTYIDLTGVNENTQSVNFKLYPVPAENEIQIQAEGFQKAEIYSLTGQKLMESLQTTLNVNALASGVYLLKVYDVNGNCASQRVIVK